MTTILCIETSADVCSIALAHDSEITGYRVLEELNAHSANLAKLTKELLSDCQTKISDIHSVAVSKGPGSFTGLRIGVAFAKGICFGNNIPLIGIDTLYSLAFMSRQISGFDEALFLPLIDTRTGEAYYCLYDHNLNPLLGPDSGKIVTSLFSEVPNNLHLVISGNYNYNWFDNNFSGAFNPSFINIKPDALNLVLPALDKFRKAEFEDLTWFEPYYLRDFKAKKFSLKIAKILNRNTEQ